MANMLHPLTAYDKWKIKVHAAGLSQREVIDSLTLFESGIAQPTIAVSTLNMNQQLTWFGNNPLTFYADNSGEFAYITESLEKTKGYNLSNFCFTAIIRHLASNELDITMNYWEKQELEFYCEVLKSFAVAS